MLGQDPLELVDRAERLALLPGLVLRAGQQHPAVLTQRRGADQDLRLGEDLAVPPGPQQGVDPELLGLQAQLGQSRAGRNGRPPALQVGEGLPVPQVQRVGEQVRRPIGLAEGEQLAGPADLVLEPQRVHVVGGQVQRIALR